MNNASSHYDAVLIGAGQIGDPLGRALARSGHRTLLIERELVGGTCTNRGCTPTKTLAASADVAHTVRRAGDFGVLLPGGPARSGDDVRVNIARVVGRKNALVDDFRADTRRELDETPNLDLVFGHARFVGPKTVLIESQHGSQHGAPPRVVSGDRVVINTGGRPALPPVDGLSSVPFLDSTSVQNLEQLPEHLLILGGGYIGLEYAQMFRRFGCRVTLVEASPALLTPDEDDDVTGEMARLLQSEGITVRLSTTAEHAAPGEDGGGVRLSVQPENGPAEIIAGSHLLVATGRAPNTDDLGLQAAGVQTDDAGHIRVNERLETGVPGVWAGGEVAGSPAFTHIAYDDCRVLRDQLLGPGKRTTAGRLVPHAVFTDPQLGRVGLSEKQARKEGRSVRVARIAAQDLARPRETGNADGFIKAIVDAGTREILGFAAFCRDGGEIMGAVTVAMMAGLPYTALRDGVFAHPTLVEGLNNLFLSLDAGEAGH